MASEPEKFLKLNLGCGQNHRAGYVNVDKFGTTDVLWDLEVFPWPWSDSSVEEIVLFHALEHMGERVETYLGIIREMYRVCRHGARIEITLPHPRHDDFLCDPTHVRAFLPTSFLFFSKARNLEWKEKGVSSTPLGLYLDVDLVTVNVHIEPEQPWREQFETKKISQAELADAARRFNNVLRQFRVELSVEKAEG